MASVSASIHVQADDAPHVQRLESGSIAIWVEGKHAGPTIIGSEQALAVLRDAIASFLASTVAGETEAEAA